MQRLGGFPGAHPLARVATQLIGNHRPQQFGLWLVDEEEADRSPLERVKAPIVPEQPIPVRVVGKGRRKRTIAFANKIGIALERYLRVRSQRRHVNLPHLWLAERATGPLRPNAINQMLSAVNTLTRLWLATRSAAYVTRRRATCPG